MDDEDPAARFGAALRRLIDQLDGALEQAYRDDGLDFRPRFTPVVRALDAEGELTIRALSRRLGLSHSAISQTVTQMTQRGFIQARAGDDARERMISLTQAGRDLLPRLRAHWQAATRATRALADEIGGDLVAGVNRANTALAERPFRDRLRPAAQLGSG